MSGDYSKQGAETEQPSPGIGLADIYFILFRRKWLIVAGLALGIISAAVVWKKRQPLFQSQAKLMVKYVTDIRSFDSLDPDARVRAIDSTGSSIINSEVEILTSWDIAREVAGVVTPEKLLPGSADLSDPALALNSAAGVIAKNLRVDPPRGSIITIRFEHRDPAVAQPVLEQLIETYFKKHRQVHRASESMDEVLIQQRDQLRSQLSQTEEQLRQTKARAGVVSVDEAKRTYAQQMAAILEDLFSAHAEQAQRRAALTEMRRLEPTNATPAASSGAPVTAVPQVKIDEYRRVVAQAEYFDRREREMLTTLTLETPLAKTNHLQLVEAQRLKAKLELEYPDLLRAVPPLIPGTVPVTLPAGGDMASQSTWVLALEAKIQVLSNQLASVRAEAARVDEVEGAIMDLQRKRAQLETQYLYVERGLQQTMFDKDLGSGKSANISRVQAPSPPFRDMKKLYKMMAMALMGGVASGIGLAFVLELFLDRTLKRSKEVESLLHHPLFLSIPRLRLPQSTASAVVARRKHSASDQSAERSETSKLPPEDGGGLVPFHEALRDRLVNYFEIREMTHKPKMIAVTSCNEGAGVSSIATGLAASLSETGDGNVLLVDMRGERGAAHAFYQGKPACGLVAALESESRTTALVHKHLYVVSADSVDQELQRFMPRQFSQIVPKLKASDYDYIIFDMPPVAQTSITAKVARFMDMILMVVESNKTDREVARRAVALLAESKATVATILNKHRDYVPAWLHQELG